MQLELITKEDLLIFKQQLINDLDQHIARVKNHKKWMNAKEIKDRFNLSTDALQKLRIQGKVIYTKVGTTIFYDYEHLSNLAEQNIRNVNKFRTHELYKKS